MDTCISVWAMAVRGMTPATGPKTLLNCSVKCCASTRTCLTVRQSNTRSRRQIRLPAPGPQDATPEARPMESPVRKYGRSECEIHGDIHSTERMDNYG